ncbi:MAG: cation:proton antiporter [Neisseriales bacterium]|nr:MAG: cation:proton antiporter [Neisseriales bacterium]
MHGEIFIHDMATIMLVAGIVTLIFHRFKQPVVLGYLAAGIIIGPYTAPFVLIHDKQTISILAELGVVFLMFSLGMEFSLKKIAKVGAIAFITAICETSLMIAIGYNLGHYFGWSQMNCIFLGAMMAISSTTIIVKALGELGLKQHKFAQLIFGILIVEDILAIAIIALLSGIATTGAIQSDDIFDTVGQLSLFIIVTLTIGLLTIPKLLEYVAKFNSHETMLISVLGLCFGFCLMVLALNYSIALGAFIIGAIIAEARPLHLIEKLIEPLRDMFCAIFFVTIGMMFNPSILLSNFSVIIIISITLIAGKIIGNTIGAFVSGEKAGTSLKVGMGLAQIGEFSFIIAALGASLKVTGDFLYPIAIAVSAITTLTTPYLINLADPFASFIRARAPRKLIGLSHYYTRWLGDLHPRGDSALIVKMVAKIIAQVIVNCALVMAVFMAGAYLADHLNKGLLARVGIIIDLQIHKSIITSCAILLSLPFLIAAYRKLKALGMIFSEILIHEKWLGKHTYQGRRVIFETLPVAAIIGIMSLIFSVSHHVLPQDTYLIPIIVAMLGIAYLCRNPFIRLQSWLQIRLFSVMEDKPLE